MKRISVCALLAFGLSSPAHAAESPELQAVAQMQQFMGVMEGYFELINVIHAVNSDSDKAAILQLQKIQEIYEERGDRADAAAILRRVIANTKSPAVKNTAATMLADTLKESGRASEAIEVLSEALEAHLN